jgi:small-conductance mechanosensitive channel
MVGSHLSNVVNSLKRLVVVFILLMVLAAIALLIYNYWIQKPINLPDFVDKSIQIVVIAGFWLAILFFIRRSKPAIARNFGEQPATIVQTFIGGIAILVMIFALLNVIGVPPESLLAGAGIASIAISLIVSSFVSNLLSGAFVFLTHRFRVGDNVIVNNIPGIVTEINALVVRISTDIGQIAISNNAISSGTVIITKIHPHETASYSRLPYSKGDRVVTKYMEGEGTVKEITPIHTTILLDSEKEIVFLNSSILTGSVAVAKITQQEHSPK